jgi:hypothetical protein
MGPAHALSTVGARQAASAGGTGIASCAALSVDSRCCGENARPRVFIDFLAERLPAAI